MDRRASERSAVLLHRSPHIDGRALWPKPHHCKPDTSLELLKVVLDPHVEKLVRRIPRR